MTVRITAMSAGPGAVKYLLKQEGCADHSHAAGYYAHGVEGGAIEDRPLGWWVGEGVGELGVTAGDVVTESDVEALIGHVCHPQRYREEMAAAESRITARLGEISGKVSSRERAAIEDEEYATAIDNSRLGSAPRKFKSTEERVKARLEAEPLADKKRIDAIRLEEAKATRKAVGFFDITLSAPKSISIYHAGLLATGRTEDAAVIEAAHRAGVAAALKFAQQEAGYSRAGHHGGSAEHRASSGRYVDAHEWIGMEFFHLTSRAGDPQIHSHATIPNRVKTVDADGTEKWRTLDSWSMKNTRLGMDAEYLRAMEQHVEQSHLPIVMELRPDGVAREIVGSTEAQRAAFSTRKGEVDKDYNDWAAAYEARRGHEPGRYLRAMMREQFVLASRDRKAEVGATTSELAARYEAAAMERLGQSLGEAVAMMENAGREADRKLLATGGPQRLDSPGIIAQAVARVQEKKTTWTAADLRSELGMVVPRLPGIGEAERKTLFDGMVADALAGRAGLSDLDRPVQVGGFEVLPTPADLQLLNGKSTFDPPTNARYATTGQLSNEERLVSMANTVRPELVMPAEKVERVIREANLSGDQAQAVREILTGGREWQTLIGPAGAGKTYVTAVVVKAWEEHFGGKVVGLAPSQAAAEVLREAGVTTTMNTTRFLGWNRGDFAPTPEQKAMAQLGPKDMVILDEAGMAANPHMFELGEVARAAGAKVLGAGDDAQLTAVGAGGGLRMLTEHAPFVELDTVRRFRNKDGSINEWYADASLRLRSGDATVVPELHKRGLLHQGTADEMTERDVRRHVANMLDGRTGALSASKNETAARLNNEIRSRLVEAGVVEERGLWLDSEVAGGVTVGRGDEIVARKNTRKNDSAGDEVVNRRHYTVDEVRPDGSLAVRRILDGQGPNGETQYGGQAVLPADYVREQVALGYATTVHGVQGATVDEGRGHGMPDSAEA
ncbi:MobF family relaxase, partial [Longispora sp. NPDC051575]|uniref:MobF family relaxase n=1 Tax=Longispora sp. NPDC051575 TaxID=3154943 RepID=UPI0034351FA3